jgi:GNAT superfamily N-acetyltransferase
MTHGKAPETRQIHHPHQIDNELADELTNCWVQVTNTGGAAGFPFPPVTTEDVAPVTEQLITGLHPQRSRLILALVDGVLAGWLNLRRDQNPLVAHWGTIHHAQTHTAFRHRGIGTILMNHARHIARNDMGLEQLHLAARGGAGLEDFYRGLGWQEIGRWPAALRLAPGDDRDETLMLLTPL